MKNSIHIYSFNIINLFGEDNESAQGGAEYQLMTLGLMLKDRGFSVTYFVGDFGQSDVYEISGFRFVKIIKSETNRITKFYWFIKTILTERPEIILERGASNMVFMFSLVSRLISCKYYFSAASDINFSKNSNDPAVIGRVGKLLYRVGVYLAHQIFAQKVSQLEMLKNNFGLNAIVIPHFSHNVPELDITVKEYDVAWVANIIPYKKPELFIKLASMLPAGKFVMIGGARDISYFNLIKSEAEQVSNLIFMGFLPHDKANEIIAKSKIIVNTTVVDGKFEEAFPNTFLQGWQYGVPAVSLISNPDGILNKYKIGFCSGNLEKMQSDIQILLKNRSLWELFSNNGVKYIQTHHNNEETIKKYISAFSI